MVNEITKVLIANRGEIAVRIIRTCRDLEIASVAVYAIPDVGACHVRMADEAYSLGGLTPAESYLNYGKILQVASASGADAVHPGYGFLSENADFAQAVIDAGLIWIGPPPAAIRALGDKVVARRIAAEVGAPLVPGTDGPVANTDEIVAFVGEFGLPVAIKASFGGGGRGLKVARHLEEIPELFESATREARAAFGRGECFVEGYLSRTRHVETQCLADQYGTVVVASTRDCSLQRRHQKLVEEAPAPFLTEEQNRRIVDASKSILRHVNYVGAGTCEFLVGDDGSLSFLEVNTRLQVEHTVTEEITGLDLVDLQIRIARGERLTIADQQARGHAIEFRINAEDPGRNFLPAPGRIDRFDTPSGPGVRVDSGVVAGDQLGAAWDSMLAKLIVTGPDRSTTLRRARRALREFSVEGVATVLPFHRAVVEEPDFTDSPMRIHTRWIEEEFSNCIEPQPHVANAVGGAFAITESLVVEVNGRRVEVTLPSLREQPRPPDVTLPPRRPKVAIGTLHTVRAEDLVAPMLGVVVKIAVSEGDSVVEGNLIAVVEAMKMEQPVVAHRSGLVTDLTAVAGQSVGGGDVLCRIVDK